MRSIAVARAAAAVALLPLLGACAARHGVPDPIVTDRPDFTESAETVPAGMVQVEGGVTASETAFGRATTYGELLLRAGLSAGAELRVGLPSYTVMRSGGRRGSGWEDASLGAKLRLVVPEEGAPAVVPTTAIIIGSSLPTGSRVFRGESAVVGATLALAWGLGERAGLGVNGGYERPVEGHPDDADFLVSGALSIDATDRVGLFVEAYSTGTTYVDGGLTWRLGPALQLDARVGASVGDMLDERFVGLGFARRF